MSYGETFSGRNHVNWMLCETVFFLDSIFARTFSNLTYDLWHTKKHTWTLNTFLTVFFFFFSRSHFQVCIHFLLVEYVIEETFRWKIDDLSNSKGLILKTFFFGFNCCAPIFKFQRQIKYRFKVTAKRPHWANVKFYFVCC